MHNRIKINPVIQRADYADLPIILELQKLAFLDEAKLYNNYQLAPLTQNINEIQNDYQDCLFLKATYNGQIIGSIKIREQDSSCWLGRLIVFPEFQNKGIGRMLLAAAEKTCPTAKEFILFTGSYSEKNIRLYESVGYKQKEEYIDKNNPDIILVKMKKIMNKEILFVLLNNFADWEGAYIAPSLSCGVEPGSQSKYVVKTVSITKDPILSCGGFKVLPDYEINDIPTDYAGVVLIGGTRWLTSDAEPFIPLVKEAIRNNKLVAGICNASVFLGMHGFLNEVKHTSNGLEYLKNFAGANYTGERHYVNEAAVRDRNIVTANGFSALEFCREILYVLEADTEKKIEKSYRMYKTGVWEAPETE